MFQYDQCIPGARSVTLAKTPSGGDSRHGELGEAAVMDPLCFKRVVVTW